MNEANLAGAGAMPGKDTGATAPATVTRGTDSNPSAIQVAGAATRSAAPAAATRGADSNPSATTATGAIAESAAPATASAATEPGRGAPWQRVLQHAVRDIDELAELLEIPAARLRALSCASGFPLLVPRGFVARMKKRDIGDPLLLQVLPRSAENTGTDGFNDDPLRERDIADKGVIRKYQGRALLIASGACPIHCRYCFRREFPYSEQLASRHGWEGAIDRLTHDGGIAAEQPASRRGRERAIDRLTDAGDSAAEQLASRQGREGAIGQFAQAGDISEVILSGGDPLSLSNRNLKALFDALQKIESVRCIRIHTRFPITIPERIDAGLLALFARRSAKLVVVVHCNHANELDRSVATALGKISGATDLLLNQSVLLRDINDDVATLATLSRRLFDCGVLPYYLNMLDLVTGTAHFEVDDARARSLLAGLRSELPGYLVPKLVREVPGAPSKMPV